jgi:hypothetical protein
VELRFVLGALAVLINLMDNATTFVCLHEPRRGFEVYEANPVARWIFDSIGLLEGLLLETALTTAAVAFVVITAAIPPRSKLVLLAGLVLLPAWAVANNLSVMNAIGALPLP